VQFGKDDAGSVMGGATGGTGRFLVFGVEKWREWALPADLAAPLMEYSPYNPLVDKGERISLLVGVAIGRGGGPV
jgi:hypothetical protein